MVTRSRYSNFISVDDYLLSVDTDRRPSLAKLRETIRRIAPQAEEMMRFNMPYYEYKGMLCAFSAKPDCLSFYVLDDEKIEKYKAELTGFEFGKGCIRFQDFEQFPAGVVERILFEAVEANESRSDKLH